MPRTKGQSGVEHFERRAKTVKETSSDARFSTYKTQPGSGGDGHIVIEERGKPEKK